MIEFILDTDTLTLIQEGHPEVGARFLQQPPDSVAITVLSVEEQLSGWYTQIRKAKRLDRLAWAYRRLTANIRFLARLQVLTYDEKAMQRFEELRKQKIKIGRTDLGIAANVAINMVNAIDYIIRWVKKTGEIQLKTFSARRSWLQNTSASSEC